MPVGADAPAIDELIGRNARERLTEVKRGLRSILELLAGRSNGQIALFSTGPAARAAVARGKPSRGKAKGVVSRARAHAPSKRRPA